MIIGGLQKASLIDYPGRVSAVVFTRGCNLRCRYCQNPELVLPEKYCAPISDGYVINFLESRRGKLDGVVITGGEPTIQNGLLQFMKKIKAMGYQIKFDTSGISPRFLELVIKSALVDYIAMDVKAPFEKYEKVVGVQVDIERMKQSIKIIKSCAVDYEFRTTVAKSLTSKEDLVAIAQSITGAKRYVLQKFRKSENLDQEMAENDTYSDVEFEMIAKTLGNYVGCVSIR